jgi:hypothetical protein
MRGHARTRFVPTSFPPLFPPKLRIGAAASSYADGLSSSFSTAVRSGRRRFVTTSQLCSPLTPRSLRARPAQPRDRPGSALSRRPRSRGRLGDQGSARSDRERRLSRRERRSVPRDTPHPHRVGRRSRTRRRAGSRRCPRNTRAVETPTPPSTCSAERSGRSSRMRAMRVGEPGMNGCPPPPGSTLMHRARRARPPRSQPRRAASPGRLRAPRGSPRRGCCSACSGRAAWPRSGG